MKALFVVLAVCPIEKSGEKGLSASFNRAEKISKQSFPD